MHPLWAQQATLVRTLQTVLCRLQLQGMTPNRCDEQDCNEVIDEEHFLCRRHWQQFMEGEIAECFQCGEFKPTSFPLCRRCNAEATNRPTRAPQNGEPPEQSLSGHPATRAGPTTTMMELMTKRPRTNGTGSTGRTTASATTVATGTPTTSLRWST